MVQTANYATVAITDTAAYTEFTNLLPTGGSITVNALGSGETDIYGYQLVPISVPSLNSPNINIVATQNSVLDFGKFASPTLGGLSVGGSLTLQDVYPGGSVTIGGDVVATNNAWVVSASGAGSRRA